MQTTDILILVVILAWLGGFTLHIGGGLIHLLLVIVLILLIVRLLPRRKD